MVEEDTVSMKDGDRKVSLIYSGRNELGGSGSGQHGGGNYGEITKGSQTRLFGAMTKSVGFNKNSHLVDVGSGQGKVVMHSTVIPGVELAGGVEIDPDRHLLGVRALQKAQAHVDLSQHVVRAFLVQRDITDAQTLNPFSHIYMFDKTFYPWLVEAIAERFNRSVCAQALVSFLDRAVVEEAFDVVYVASVVVFMAGSGAQQTARIYRRKNPPRPGDDRWQRALQGQQQLYVPSRAEPLPCDQVFYHGAVQALTQSTAQAFGELCAECHRICATKPKPRLSKLPERYSPSPYRYVGSRMRQRTGVGEDRHPAKKAPRSEVEGLEGSGDDNSAFHVCAQDDMLVVSQQRLSEALHDRGLSILLTYLSGPSSDCTTLFRQYYDADSTAAAESADGSGVASGFGAEAQSLRVTTSDLDGGTAAESSVYSSDALGWSADEPQGSFFREQKAEELVARRVLEETPVTPYDPDDMYFDESDEMYIDDGEESSE